MQNPSKVSHKYNYVPAFPVTSHEIPSKINIYISALTNSIDSYNYFRQTSSQMNGITEDDFVSNYRMTSSVVSKGKYQHYSSVQKTDGMVSQFGYTETYAVLNENKLTVVSGAFLSTDMMERQSFMQLIVKFAENVKY